MIKCLPFKILFILIAVTIPAMLPAAIVDAEYGGVTPAPVPVAAVTPAAVPISAVAPAPVGVSAVGPAPRNAAIVVPATAPEVAVAAGGGRGPGPPPPPTQAGNVSAVSSILHPKDPKEAAVVVYEVPEPMTQEDTQELLLDDSINAYPGPCACPYSRNSDGFECGVEAAYYKPGGYRIYCYPEDLRGQQFIFYRKTH